MSRRKIFLLIVMVTLLLTPLTSSPTTASPPPQGKGPEGVGAQSIPTVDIQNAYIQAMSSNGGRFLIGTTGGDPGASNDDNKRLLYGYPTNVGSSFSTLRVINGGTTTDYRLGDTNWDSTGVAPVASPTSDGTIIRTVWEIDGIRVEERLYFSQSGGEWGRPDTTAIEYDISNNTTSSRDVGLRIMLDTMIGDNDGAPFYITFRLHGGDPHGAQFSKEFESWGGMEPEYWIAYESPTFDPDSLRSRGQVSGGNATPPDRFIVAHWGGALCGGVPGLFDTDWDYTVDGNFAITCDSAFALYYNPDTLAPGQTKTIRTYYGIAPESRLELTGLEVTQAVQDLNNSVVLIQDKPTFVRAHVQSTVDPVRDVTAKLIGRRNGSELPDSPQDPVNRIEHTGVSVRDDAIEVKPAGVADRGASNDSFLFELPDSWLSGTVELEFEDDSHPIACREHADTDNDCKATVTFESTPPLDVRIVGAIWKESGGTTHSPTFADIRELVQEIEATYPIPHLKWDNPYDFEVRFNDFVADPMTLNIRLAEQRILDGCVNFFSHGCQRIYVGVIVDPPDGTSLMGLGGIPPRVASGFWVGTYKEKGIIPHEIGHALGRFHTPFCDAKTLPWWHYPYSDGHISSVDSGDNALYGFHIFTNTKYIYPPDTGDLMSYCYPLWPSDWTYEALHDKISSLFGESSLAYQTANVESLSSLLVSGRITPTLNTGSIESVYEFTLTGVTLPISGTYALHLEDTVGNTLATYPFEPELTCPFPSGCSEDELVGAFAVVIPANSQMERILLLHNGQTLASRIASAHAPTVTVISPNGGEALSGTTTTLSWSADDLDGDPLKYVVQYSADAGASWQALISGWPSTIYELNLRAIAGTDQGLLRVLASDGFHTAQDQSDGTFTVAKHPPQANIQTPEDNSLYSDDQTIILRGNAYDNEDGLLDDTALSWSSDLDGALGSGRSIAVNASTLVEGTHTITLTAQDSDVQTDTASITVQVYRERPALPTILAVSPATLSFIAAEGGGQTAWQTLLIRNDGDGTMVWSAAADQSWILTSSLEGTAPANIAVAADPTGLSVGEYTGNITLTAPGAANSPQTIGVTLDVREPSPVYLPVILKQ